MAEGGPAGEGQMGNNALHRVLGWSSVARSYSAGRGLNLTGSRNLRRDLHQVLMGLTPLIEQSPLNVQPSHLWRQAQQHYENPRPPSSPSIASSSSSVQVNAGAGSSYVINMEPEASPTPPLPNTRSLSDVVGGAVSAAQQTGPNNAETGTGTDDNVTATPEVRAFLMLVDKYVTFVLILLLKLAFDHRVGMLAILGLFITFCHANSVIKREVSKQAKRHLSSLLIVVTNVCTCVCFVYFLLADKGLAYALILVPPYTQPIGGLEVLWIVVVTDFVLKLITILVKAVILALPACLTAFPRRGRYYLFVECCSQLYRSVMPMQHWLYYFSESYTGTGKMFSMILSGAYLLCKCTDIVSKTRAWKRGLIQAMSNVNYGHPPTAEQTKAVGDTCPICQDDFKRPVVLACNHIFCEECVSVWFDRERTCPMCRAQIADDPTWRDGSTTFLIQVF
ncbi:E3 ubiquitin-protein ligase RNFT2 [Dermacentor albipictus]|uniref:E3 ubiquitin-protein ligase RNFT2 n=1 Tax=Dermacentor albipictus TaxID=60249 RepID=UPI0031FC5962